jgi:hypothetical protein
VSEPGLVSVLLINLAAEADVTPGILALIIQGTNSRFCHSHNFNCSDSEAQNNAIYKKNLIVFNF